MKRCIVGIIGRSRVGKDTVARMIQETFKEPPFEIHHIAKTLKDGIEQMYGLSHEQLYGNLKDVVDLRYGHSPRELCTIWNTKLTHMHGPKFLVHRFFEMQDANPANIIIPDVRFCHDCYEIRRRQGILIKIVRTKFPLHIEGEGHIDALAGDITITNNSSLESLQKTIKDQVIPLIKT